MFSCNNKKNHAIDFYYWRSNFSINQTEKDYADSLKSEKLYVRFFDVDYVKNVRKPIGIIRNFKVNSTFEKYIPTVFITNQTFQNATEVDVKNLAANVYQLINEIAKSGELLDYKTIQIDCDWTKNTQKNYFTFLRELEKVSKKEVSVTLRLHQVKFKDREAIPPVNHLVLMCYSTENPTDNSTRNSILDLDIAKDYLQNINDYPKTFDVALPIFSWAILTNHLGQKKIINGMGIDDLDLSRLEQINETTFRVKDEYFLKGFYLSKNFTIKIEQISPELLEEIRNFLDKKIKKDFRLIYYHLDEQFLKQYKTTQLL